MSFRSTSHCQVVIFCARFSFSWEIYLNDPCFKKVFMSPSALIVPLLLLAAGVGFLLLFFDGENVLLMKYNQYRITQARDEQVEVKQDQSLKGCSQKSDNKYINDRRQQ